MPLYPRMSEEKLYRALGTAVAARRRILGLTQSDVAASIGLTRATLANIEAGRQGVLLHHLYRLASALRLGSILDLTPPSIGPAQEPAPPRLDDVEVTESDRTQIEAVLGVAVARDEPLARPTR